MKIKIPLLFSLVLAFFSVFAQDALVSVPPMGFTSWPLFAEKVNETEIKAIADAMAYSGLLDAGFSYILIDDGWQGGRDNKNSIIPDPKKFPSGMKSLCDYLHSKGFKVGIYSDADQLTCAGYTGSLYFEEQDAKTFADWGIDYLKYDYCGAPQDVKTAKARYLNMAKAIHLSGRHMVLGVCEWGDRKPWLWAGKAGGQLWRTTADIRDKWKSKAKPNSPKDLHKLGAGILDILDINADLQKYAMPGRWNDPDMLVVGLYGNNGPAGDLGGTGCTEVEYRSQMSLWSLMAAPLIVSCDVRTMNQATKDILLNKDVIRINQDSLGKQALRRIKNANWQVFVKPLSDGDIAVGILNISDKKQTANINLSDIGTSGKSKAFDLWDKSSFDIVDVVHVDVEPHETKLYRLSN